MSDKDIIDDACRWRFVATRLSRLILTTGKRIGDQLEIDMIAEQVNFTPCTKESADAAIDRLIQQSEGGFMSVARAIELLHEVRDTLEEENAEAGEALNFADEDEEKEAAPGQWAAKKVDEAIKLLTPHVGY